MKGHTFRVVVAFLFFSAVPATAQQQPWASPHGTYTPSPLGSSPQHQNPYADSNKPNFPNANAGYPGSELPPNEYHPDARMREHYRERLKPLPPLDGGMSTRQPNPYCTGEYCGR